MSKYTFTVERVKLTAQMAKVTVEAETLREAERLVDAMAGDPDSEPNDVGETDGSGFWSDVETEIEDVDTHIEQVDE